MNCGQIPKYCSFTGSINTYGLIKQTTNEPTSWSINDSHCIQDNEETLFLRGSNRQGELNAKVSTELTTKQN